MNGVVLMFVIDGFSGVGKGMVVGLFVWCLGWNLLDFGVFYWLLVFVVVNYGVDLINEEVLKVLVVYFDVQFVVVDGSYGQCIIFEGEEVIDVI